MKITLHDTFNGYRISTHRSLEAAVKAERKFLCRVEKANGNGSYVTTEIRNNGAALTEEERDELTNVRIKLDIH